MSGPKRHHFVPRAFLERFGNVQRVAVRWRTGRNVITNVTNVAVESGFYDLIGLDGEKSLGFEMGLSEIEAEMLSALPRVDAEKRPPPGHVAHRRSCASQTDRVDDGPQHRHH